MLSAQVAPLCCASRSIPSFTACFVCARVCVLLHARLVGLHVSSAWPACRVSSIDPELIHCARQVHPPPCPPACPPACFVCVHVCVLLLHAAWSACMSHPAWPACRASSIGPELMRCAPQVRPSPCPRPCPPASYVARVCAAVAHARLVCLPVSPAWPACLLGMCSPCVVCLACSAYPALAHCACAAHVL